MGRAAAFFDLDRTLLRGASGPLLTEALQVAGIAPSRSLPGQGAIYKLFDLVGETLPTIALARGAALLSRGWSREAVREAATDAADRLDRLVAPYARALLDDHRSEGRPVVLATTTPHDLIEPFAQRLAFDAVVATRYAEDDEGFYTGQLAGEFVWAAGKVKAVKRWAAEHDIDLESSYAYSDSFYDLPLLSAVGNPTAVNPDPRLLALATLRRWPVIWLDVPPGVPKFAGLEPFDVVRLAARPELMPYVRFEMEGVDRLRDLEGGIVVANHRSYFDPVALGLAVAQAGRSLRFLGKKEVFEAPVVGSLARAMGAIRVDRGSATAGDSLRLAARAIAAGDLVGIMPQGTIPRGRDFFDPVLKGKTGAARLAGLTKAPVIPVGMWGTEKLWPRSSRVPRLWNVTNPPLVTIRVGEPVSLAYDEVHRDTDRIMQAIVELLPPEARETREPTAEELALTKPKD